MAKQLINQLVKWHKSEIIQKVHTTLYIRPVSFFGPPFIPFTSLTRPYIRCPFFRTTLYSTPKLIYTNNCVSDLVFRITLYNSLCIRFHLFRTTPYKYYHTQVHFWTTHYTHSQMSKYISITMLYNSQNHSKKAFPYMLQTFT